MNEIKYIKNVVNNLTKNFNYNQIKNIKEDLYQEGYIGYLLGKKSFNPALEVKETTWLGNCIKYAVGDFLRKEFIGLKEKDILNFNTMIEDDMWIAESTPEDEVVEYYSSINVNNTFDKLSEQQQRVIKGYLNKEHFDSIAKELNVSNRGVYFIYNEAVKALKEAYEV